MTNKEFIKGVDLSFVDEVETEGGQYYIDGQPADVYQILDEAGVNAVRLRLWHTPSGGYTNLDRTIEMAKRIKAYNMEFLLDLHYSDYWADPGKQIKPKAWETLSFEELVDVVYSYTKEVMEAFQKEGLLPDMVQIGNEITNGMLWEEGKIYLEKQGKEIENWDGIIPLLKAGLNAVKDVDSQVRTMIHIDRGGDNPGSRKFYDQMAAYKLDYDVIGLSYYPWWHGPYEDFEYNMADVAQRYQKEIIVVEVAYPWALPDYIPNVDDEPDIRENLVPGYPATEKGQKAYLEKLIETVKQTPDQLGKGIYYWEPCWIPSKDTWSVGHENNWSHLTLFDNQGNKLAGLDAFNK
ncbi:arabinogalactan endo-1,4-beta-galactosidase [Gracilibacillus caseinilyticus]|uniref:Arabinogalactan endo-beta-1,4-galactanase n=1 Tax=Gracilibacillus caseinilyticus TaxID=2932256 RepID=A0ABY4F1K7_9BACI|nr:glycosyl hydrolase 53 family protein [Gracilibacillus caseinilyticus]UOQ50090.1 arabinogalactan endo-1,4-beta-galactosidase [Gracilibacillus caseinilyticus]